MNDKELDALSSIRLSWAPVPDDVWRPPRFHVDGLHAGVLQAVQLGLREVAGDEGAPIGLILQGQGGSGKTHLLGWLREQVQEQEGGYFFLISLLNGKDFWTSVLNAMISGLAREVRADQSQLQLLLRRLSARVGAPRAVRRAFVGETKLTSEALDGFVDGLAAADKYVSRTSRDTVRALALTASSSIAHQDIAESYFSSSEEGVPGERAAWGMRRNPRTAEEIVHDLSQLLAITGPTVMAFDQIDVLLAQSTKVVDTSDGRTESRQQIDLLNNVAGGLMTLRERTRRTLSVVACLPASWEVIKTSTTSTVQDRFRVLPSLTTIKERELGRAIIARRFKPFFESRDFVPPYATWPVREEAFADAGDYTPRRLLMAVDKHIRSCLLAGKVVELTHLGDEETSEQAATAASPLIGEQDLAQFDERFATLRAGADITTPLEPYAEDTTIPQLLQAGLKAWIMEQDEQANALTADPLPSAKPDLHARLRLTLDEETEDQVHWCFRAITDHHHGNAALYRLRRALNAAALDPEVPKRSLVLLRNSDWSTGAKTAQAVAALTAAGGRKLPLTVDDLRSLSALRALLDEDRFGVRQWLMARKPAHDLEVLEVALAGMDSWTTSASAPATSADAPSDAAPTVDDPSSDAPTFVVGRDFDTDEPATLELEVLRKHMTIFAGSGSGKTVLIRRIVEECALKGVSAIVLDPNNDLARLGDSWPEPPPQWAAGDPAKAADYLADTDVVVWTPRREGGRPLSFQPLPDFSATVEDPDEFGEAVDAAVAALAPRAMLGGRTARTQHGRAVLRRAVEYVGRRGGGGLDELIAVLDELPDGVADLVDADKIAAALAQTLKAARTNDPLFGGTSTPMDPGLLLTPAAGKRARVSVISFVGLPDDAGRQSFVNQLQMALFAWIKKHPAGDRPLLGLFVMDEAQTFAPSGAMTACTQSTLALASQARKYGLGLIFATQSPKGLHNRIPGNATTQFYGLLNSPVQVEAAREMARAKGGDVPDISRLRSGEFYLAAEGSPPQKVRTPLCLSHHPRSPLTTEEVIDRARADRPPVDHD